MPKTTIEQWRMFKAVVDHGGFNQASAKIHKSQSSIHHAVRKLEETLGTKLFEVQGRKALLTDSGNLLLHRGTYLLDEMKRVEQVAKTLSQGVEAELILAVDEAFPQNVLYSVLEKVSGQFPLLKVEVIETVLSGTNELIKESRAHIGLSPFPMPQGLNEEICQIEFLAVASPSHLLHRKTGVLRYEDLKSCRQIVVRDSSVERKSDSGWLGSEQRWTVSHVRTSIDLVSQGLGYAWLPLPSIKDLLDKGMLKPLKLESGQRRHSSFYLNYEDADTLGPAAREFIGQLRLATLNPQTRQGAANTC